MSSKILDLPRVIKHEDDPTLIERLELLEADRDVIAHYARELERRVVFLEKKIGIDHPREMVLNATHLEGAANG